MDQTAGWHRTYVLRLWRVRDGQEDAWRASLQDVLTSERLGFAGFDDAVAFLRGQMGASPEDVGTARDLGQGAP